MSDKPEARQSEPPKYLGHGGIQAAMTHLRDNFPMSKWTAAEEDAWNDCLCQLREGELRPALTRACSLANDPRFRPEAYAVLSIVLEQRRAAEQSSRMAQAERNAEAMRALAREDPPPASAHEEMRRVLQTHSTLTEAHRRRQGRPNESEETEPTTKETTNA